MALTITDTWITSDLTDAYAEFRPHAAADGNGAWVMSLRASRLFDRNQAISAMTIEELRASARLRSLGPDEALIAVLEAELRAQTTCTSCRGGGIVPAADCSCAGPGHSCSPRPCPDCRGAGHR